MTVAAASRTARETDQACPSQGAATVRETIAVAATLCGTVPALFPLVERGMANTHDGLIHVQRLIALESVIKQGSPFTRWLPDLAYGYGQPLLLYYAPLAYLPGLAARSLGAGYAASVEIAIGLALILSALAMFVLARSLFGLMAATAAAIVYAVLPYQLVDVYVRGALAESWAFVWLPLCAWCLTRAWAARGPRWSVGVAVTVAGLVLTHNVTALLFLPALVALGLLLQTSTGRGWRGVPLRPIGALGLGLALSAWFWLPALAERHLVQIGETIEPDLFASFFVRGWPPFRLDPFYDYQYPVSTALGTPIFWPQLGLIQVGVTVVGAVAALRTRGIARGVAVWAALLALGGYLMQLRPLAPLYDLVPLLTFVQFPWRLLAVVGLGTAILAGVLVEVLSRRAAIRAVFAVAIVALSLATALARLDPEPLPVDDRMLSVETITRIELADLGLGTTHSGEYLPVSSGQRSAARFRKTLIEAGGGRDGRVMPDPTALEVERLDWRPDRIRVDVTAQAPERLILHQLAFPGWAAWVDGSPIAVEAAAELGLLAVDVPAGRHTVELAWSWTPIRLGAAITSLVGLLVLVPLASSRGWPPMRYVGAATLLTAAIGSVLIMASWWPLTVASVEDPAVGRAQDVGDDLTLVEARHDTSALEVSGSLLSSSDRVVTSRLVWLVRQAPTTGYRAYVEVVAADGRVLHRAPWVYEPLSRLWERGELVPTTVTTRIPFDVGAGEYGLRLVFDRPAGIPSVALGSIALATRETGSFAEPPERVPIGTDMRLWAGPGAAQGEGRPIPVKPGASLDVPLHWRQLGATPNVDRELLVVAVLRVPGGDVVSEPRRPGDWFAPLPFWQRGDLVEQNLRLSVPAWAPRGTYPLAVRVYSRDLARFGASEPGTALARPRGRPIAELALRDVTVEP